MCLNEFGTMCDNTKVIRFTIPITSKKKWWQFWKKDDRRKSLAKIIKDYSEVIEWDDTLGEISINGTEMIPYEKQYWFPVKDDEQK
jgi:hypothetical protein